jgi:[ribosomal protein S5]-alanine N-acetyltransferase
MIPTIETTRLSLRPLTFNDFADFYEYAQDPAVSGPGMWLPYPSEAGAREDFERILSFYTRHLMWWALEDRLTGKMIGRCQLAEYDREDARAELSYALHHNFWGQGLMYEAASAVLGYGFETLKLNRVGAQVFIDNQGSIRVLEKLGMVQEGCLRHYRQVRGKPENVYVYSLLSTEWRA